MRDVETVEQMVQQTAETGRMNGTLNRLLTSGLRLDLVNGRFGSLAWVVLNVVGVLVLAGAALLSYHGVWGVTAGDVVMLSAFLTTLTNSTTTLAGLAPVITKGLESVRSVGEVLQAPELEDNEGKAELTALRGAVTFEQVDYAYGTDGRTAVRDFTLDVAPGETVALVGASGAGKSTVLNLVIGFIRPTSGRLLLDGADMNALDLRTYRRFLSVVQQESVLFDGTIRENVAYGMDDADEETVRAALRQALVRLLHGRTTFVVAHRLSTVQGADRIVVMGDGRVEEIGTHEELLHRGGVYAALHSGQIA